MKKRARLKTMNPRGFRYGPSRVWGDLERSRYFHVGQQPDISTLIRTLDVKAHVFEQLRELYVGECQICGWAPRLTYGVELCEAHHIRWLSRGGDDTLANLVLVCPNHHRAINGCDAPFDFGNNAFSFADTAEPLRLLRHILAGD